MALIKSSKQKTFLITASIFSLIIFLLMPYYHAHDYRTEYYHHNSDGLYSDPDEADNEIHENISGPKHVDPHLHMKKDLSISRVNNSFQSRLQRALAPNSTPYTLSFVKVSNVPVYEHQTSKALSSFSKSFSGLSPPVC